MLPMLSVTARRGAAAALLLGLGSGPAAAAAQPLQFEQVALLPGPADLVEIGDRRAYVAAGATVTVFDLSAPAAPRRGGAWTFPEKIWGFVVRDELLYVAADLSTRLLCIDGYS